MPPARVARVEATQPRSRGWAGAARESEAARRGATAHGPTRTRRRRSVVCCSSHMRHGGVRRPSNREPILRFSLYPPFFTELEIPLYDHGYAFDTTVPCSFRTPSRPATCVVCVCGPALSLRAWALLARALHVYRYHTNKLVTFSYHAYILQYCYQVTIDLPLKLGWEGARWGAGLNCPRGEASGHHADAPTVGAGRLDESAGAGDREATGRPWKLDERDAAHEHGSSAVEAPSGVGTPAADGDSHGLERRDDICASEWPQGRRVTWTAAYVARLRRSRCCRPLICRCRGAPGVPRCPGAPPKASSGDSCFKARQTSVSTCQGHQKAKLQEMMIIPKY